MSYHVWNWIIYLNVSEIHLSDSVTPILCSWNQVSLHRPSPFRAYQHTTSLFPHARPHTWHRLLRVPPQHILCAFVASPFFSTGQQGLWFLAFGCFPSLLCVPAAKGDSRLAMLLVWQNPWELTEFCCSFFFGLQPIAYSWLLLNGKVWIPQNEAHLPSVSLLYVKFPWPSDGPNRRRLRDRTASPKRSATVSLEIAIVVPATYDENESWCFNYTKPSPNQPGAKPWILSGVHGFFPQRRIKGRSQDLGSSKVSVSGGNRTPTFPEALMTICTEINTLALWRRWCLARMSGNKWNAWMWTQQMWNLHTFLHPQVEI